jgi:hypothetical protein
MTNVLAVESTRPPWRGVPQRVFSPQRLDARFLINAQHHSVSRRMQVEATDSSDFFFEFRVRAVKPHADTMRSNFRFVENSYYRGPTHYGLRMVTEKAVAERIDRPNLATHLTKVRWIRASHTEQFQPAQQTDFGRPAWTRLILQCLDASVLDEPISPPTHCLHIDAESLCHRAYTGVHIETQQDSSSENFAIRTPILPGYLLKCLPLCGAEFYAELRQHASSLFGHVLDLITSEARCGSKNESGTYGPWD